VIRAYADRMSGMRGWEWIIILALALLLFGGYKKLPDAARGIGRSLRIFKAETKGLVDDDDDPDLPPATGVISSATTPELTTEQQHLPPQPPPPPDPSAPAPPPVAQMVLGQQPTHPGARA
jgi:sec-independent protein translocase protein TatA